MYTFFFIAPSSKYCYKTFCAIWGTKNRPAAIARRRNPTSPAVIQYTSEIIPVPHAPPIRTIVVVVAMSDVQPEVEEHHEDSRGCDRKRRVVQLELVSQQLKTFVAHPVDAPRFALHNRLVHRSARVPGKKKKTRTRGT